MIITVKSKSNASAYCPDCTWAAISISTYSDEFAKLYAVKRMGLLQLSFHDAEYGAEENLFSEQHAMQIINFVQKNKDVEELLVHCEAGLSRSPAIAAAITKIFLKEDDYSYFKRYMPNLLVYRVMMETAIKMGLLEIGSNKPIHPTSEEFEL